MNRFKSKISLNKDGNISYKRAIVVQIIELSAKEIAGVASFSSNAKIAFKKMFSSYFKKGINITPTEGGLELDVYINCNYGYSVNNVAYRVQENIKRSVESMTEFKVKRVNVHILGVVFDSNDRYTYI